MRGRVATELMKLELQSSCLAQIPMGAGEYQVERESSVAFRKVLSV